MKTVFVFFIILVTIIAAIGTIIAGGIICFHLAKKQILKNERQKWNDGKSADTGYVWRYIETKPFLGFLWPVKYYGTYGNEDLEIWLLPDTSTKYKFKE